MKQAGTRKRTQSGGSEKEQFTRIGIFGGSFDPLHVGHLIIAEQAREQLKLDRVIFVPAYRVPHKPGTVSTPAAVRLRMTRLGVKGNVSFLVSDVELRRRGISYTVDTLHQFKRMFPQAQLFLIVGSDNYMQIRSWETPKEIMRLCTLAVYTRPGFEIKAVPGSTKRRVGMLHGARLEISSSLIRSRIARGLSIRYLVPRVVEQEIVWRRLYR